MKLQDEIKTIDVNKKEVNKLPSTTGVYIFANSDDILYVGKSVNIKARVKSHFENARLDYKEAGIIENSNHLKYIITDSEFKALILESKLIKKFQPKYNVICRDDKSYLYIKISLKDEYPKIQTCRRENDGRSRYFGPFPCVRAANDVIREIRKVFPFCTQKKLTKKPCFYSKIGLCLPCPSAINVLNDKKERARLKRIYKKNIRQIVKILEGKTDLILKNLHEQLNLAIKKQNYEDGIKIRDRILRFENFIHDQAFITETWPRLNQSEEAIKSLFNLLVKYYPKLQCLHRIECYDISSLSLKDATASMIVFTDGLIDRKEYRRFKIRDKKTRSDFEMLEEVFKRRLIRDWNLPDLIVVDGGKPQVRAVMRILTSFNYLDYPVVGIAKRPDRIIIGQNTPVNIRVSLQNLGFNLLRQIRDESHRFAKKYHLLLRKKRLMI